MFLCVRVRVRVRVRAYEEFRCKSLKVPSEILI